MKDYRQYAGIEPHHLICGKCGNCRTCRLCKCKKRLSMNLPDTKIKYLKPKRHKISKKDIEEYFTYLDEEEELE